MLEVNDYFAGQVKSIGFQDGEHRATVGVMAPGEYRFNTGAPEVMVVLRGALTVRLPGSDVWQTFAAGSEFHVPGDSAFDLQVAQDTAYLCQFGG
ncbi:pyrimidine/purine nucleoside phosphorylase [Plesiomonas shigelloides]|uniref:pyrimidine/purine nucleoside phosphorylase n=1 Tax=Plesiomonas shigelloides TaxID=703 RepID=UPI00387F0895